MMSSDPKSSIHNKPKPVKPETSKLKPAPVVSPASKIHVKSVSPPKGPTQSVLTANNDYDDYEDDFEDYEDDFEEFEGDIPALPRPKMDDIQRAIKEENDKISAMKGRQQQTSLPSAPIERVSGPAVPLRPILDLNAQFEKSVKQGQMNVATKKQRQRYQDLAHLIQLDFTMHTLFDLAPMTEYDVYIQNFGNSESAQVETQTRDDLLDRSLQTDDYLMEDKWVQATFDLFVDSGTVEPDLPWLPASQSKFMSSKMKEHKGLSTDLAKLDSFLKSAGMVMDVLLEENGRADEIIDAFGDSGEAMEISIGSKVFGVPAFLKDWRVSSMLNVPGDSKTVLICWRPSQDRLDKGVITLYRLNDLNDPYRILICEPEITSCSMSPLHSHIVLAGTMEGSLQAWDLTETTMGEIWPGASEISYHVKRPSYSTDGLYAVEKCHEDYIVSLIPLVNAADKTSGNSFQLASVDALGNVIIWLFFQMKKQTVSKGLDAMDFGMAPGSRIKLSQSSTMKLRSRSYVGDLQVTQSQSVPHSVDRLLVGTQTGGLFLQSRFDEPCFPNTFSTSLAKFTSMDSVHGVSFSPFLSTLFLVAYASGTVGLYSLQSRVALLSWQPSQKSSTLQVIWSTHRPAVFYALGQDGSVYVWDLIEREGDPVHTITSSEDPVRTMLSTPFESRDYNVSLNDGKVKNPRLILVHASGIILSHDLLETLGQPVIDELKEFSAYIDAKILKSVE